LFLTVQDIILLAVIILLTFLMGKEGKTIVQKLQGQYLSFFCV